MELLHNLTYFLSILLYLLHETTSEVKFTNLIRNEDQKVQQKAFQDLVKRILEKSDSDLIKAEISNKFSDFTYIQTDGGNLKIQAGTAVDASYALNYYLKYLCRKHISWAGNNMGKIPSPLPRVKLSFGVRSKLRYYQNVCVSSYSYVWWSWER